MSFVKIAGFLLYVVVAVIAFVILTDQYSMTDLYRGVLAVVLTVPALAIAWLLMRRGEQNASRDAAPEQAAITAEDYEQLVATLLAQREALIASTQIDVSELSKQIRQSLSEAEALGREAKYLPALNRLMALEKFVPLNDLPSADVHLLAASLCGKMKDKTRAAAHHLIASAMGDILLKRIGTGSTVEDPVRVATVNEITEWANIQQLIVTSVKPEKHEKRALFSVTFDGKSEADKTRQAWFEIDPRTQAKINAAISIYTPIPLSEMTEEHMAILEHARALRERFLGDAELPYAQLIGAVKNAIAKASQLDAQGQTPAAIAVLQELATLRAPEEIPLASLIDAYSFLCSKVGDAAKRQELRRLLFGIHQAIAHSGDGLSPETAVHVIAIEEEYAWLNDKRLKRQAQRVVDNALGKFDVISTLNESGEARDYYFNITRMYARYGIADESPPSN
jgi:hypothetical protein